jgi:hypothetical protein
MNQNITEALSRFPDFLSSEDLVKLGIYKSIDATYQARLKRYGPEYIKLRKKILYPKLGIVKFLTARSSQGEVEDGE